MPAQQDRSLEARRAFVVGGSGGFGRALALALAARGASVVVHGGSSSERLESTLSELRSIRELRGRKDQDFRGLLRAVERPDDILAELGGLGRIDILVVAFGPFVRKRLGETSGADWERLALLDLALPGALASALLPAMARSGWGRMLFMGGTRTDSIRAYRTNAAYAAAKTGLAVLAKSLAVVGAPHGVACVGACPGLVDTEYLDSETRDRLRALSPRGRLLDPAEIAEPAIELIAADPCAASGAVVNLDGGLGL
jgi:NAD(P)-dependent dehydrogenase (short-subunit alcohol dehydrogenase family)